MTDTLEQLIAAANAPLTDPEMNRDIGAAPLRFELYHFALSLCSQKVRTVLAATGASYRAHDINLSMPLLGNYDPGYVRLRLAANPDAQFVTGYTGRSSVGSEGFDPAVVPTLVDLQSGSVVIDSLTISRHIANAMGGDLLPVDMAEQIEAELAIVDNTPHVAVLYGAHPDVDFRPERLKKGMPGVHDRKIAKIRAARDLALDDPALVAAYDAKIAKEEAARGFVGSPDDMRQAVAEMLDIVDGLDTRLADGRGWLCGGKMTLADLFWAVSLFRMKWLGMGFAWTGGHTLNAAARPHVEAYANRLFALPSFKAAVIDWPQTPRTEFVADHYPD